jgi:two-component system chemotaxis response regulator CheB
MAVRVVVVVDSAFFRRRITSILNADPEIEVIGAAMDGEQAIRRVMRLKPDIVTMDVEMPVMDGISAVKEIMRQCPVPVVMLSDMTNAGAKSSLNELEAGAVDVMPKTQGADQGEGVLRAQ